MKRIAIALLCAVALPASATSTGIYIIADPYNKPIGSNRQ